MKYKNLKKEVINWAKTGGILTESDSVNEILKKREEVNDANCKLRTLAFDLADSSNTTLQLLKLVEDGNLDAVSKVNESLGDMLITIIILSESLDINSADSLSEARKRLKEN